MPRPLVFNDFRVVRPHEPVMVLHVSAAATSRDAAIRRRGLRFTARISEYIGGVHGELARAVESRRSGAAEGAILEPYGHLATILPPCPHVLARREWQCCWTATA